MGRELDLQGPAKLANDEKTTPLKPVTHAEAPPVGGPPSGDRGEMVLRADAHFKITQYADGTIRKDNLAK